jgi:hypothetical protein
VIVEIEGGADICLDGDKYDAVFWSNAAVEKFLVPYYTNVGGPEEAMRMLAQNKQDMMVIVHLPGSEWVGGYTASSCVVQDTHDGIGLFKVEKARSDKHQGYEGSPLM